MLVKLGTGGKEGISGITGNPL